MSKNKNYNGEKTFLMYSFYGPNWEPIIRSIKDGAIECKKIKTITKPGPVNSFCNGEQCDVDIIVPINPNDLDKLLALRK